MFRLTVFENLYDNKTETRVEFETFEKFEKSLYYLATVPGYKPKRGEFLRGKKVTPLISPAIYREGTTRANANVVEWGCWAAIDVDDHKFEGDLETELKTKYGKWTYICYSTASSTPEHPKFRLVFPLTQPVEAKDIPHFWYALNKEFDSLADIQTKDVSRMFFAPAKYPGAYNFIFSNKGESIDHTELMGNHPWQKPVDSASFFDRLSPELQKEVIAHRQAKLNGSKTNVEWTSYRDCPFVNQKLISEYKSISGTDNSGRYSMIYKIMTSIACNAVKRKYPITEYEIVDLIRQLDRETSNRYAKRPLNVEASRAITYAYKIL